MGELTAQMIPLARLDRSRPTDLRFEADADDRRSVADAVGAISIRKLRFIGQLTAQGKRDWHLNGELGVTLVQACVVTDAPVTTRIDQPLTRQFLAKIPEVTAEETEMPDDDSVEKLPETLDMLTLLTEAVSLAMPDFPRAEGAELGEAVFAAPGVKPMTDEDAKPLAGLAAFRDKLVKDEDPG